MTKELFLIRHAKSDWGEPGLDDFDRPLNHRGERDAPRMAAFVKSNISRTPTLISSPALRAISTANIFADALGIPQTDIIKEHYLYDPAVESFSKILSRLPETTNTVIIFSHNPGITYAANKLSGSRIDNMPTCAVCGIQIKTDLWKDISQKQHSLFMFMYPKALP